MTDFFNPFDRRRPDGFAVRSALIKTWTREMLNLSEDAVVSVNELACTQPDCPPRQTVILVIPSSVPGFHFAVHQSLISIERDAIVHAITALQSAG